VGSTDRSFVVVKKLFRFLVAGVALTDAGRLTTQVAQIVELRTADPTPTHDFDPVDHSRMQREDSLDTDAETDLSHRDGLAGSTVLARDADSLEGLKTLFV